MIWFGRYNLNKLLNKSARLLLSFGKCYQFSLVPKVITLSGFHYNNLGRCGIGVASFSGFVWGRSPNDGCWPFPCYGKCRWWSCCWCWSSNALNQNIKTVFFFLKFIIRFCLNKKKVNWLCWLSCFNVIVMSQCNCHVTMLLLCHNVIVMSECNCHVTMKLLYHNVIVVSQCNCCITM